MSKKKLLIIIISSIVVFATALTLILVLTLGGSNSQPSQNQDNPVVEPNNSYQARSIKVVQIDGEASVTADNETINCFKGMNLYDGDTLNVKAESVIVVKFDQDKYIYLGENTEVKIKSEGKDKYKTNVYVTRGKVLAEVKNQLGEDEEFFLSSNNSVMAVRGTVFGLAVRETENEYVEEYSVYKGVTELYVFDVKDNEVIKGKISDISNSKMEITVPKDNVVPEDSFNQILDNWVSDVNEQFDDEADANQNLDEVELTVAPPSEADYQEVIDKVSKETGQTLQYSEIEYQASGYFGQYDGLDHQISIDVKTPKSTILYKMNENDEYSEINPIFKIPGSYRVYYKISAEGFTAKEDYAVIEIKKADLKIEYKNNITVPGLISGMSVDLALSKFNIFDYIDIKGAEGDSAYISNSTFTGTGNLVNGSKEYELDITLPSDIADYYNSSTFTINLTASNVGLHSTRAISTSGYLDISEISSFNKYNGVKESELFGDIEFTVGNKILTSDDYESVSFNYDYKTEGYYELSSGVNEFEVTITFTDYTLTTTLTFDYSEYRNYNDIEVSIDDVMVVRLAENSYFFNTSDITVEDDNYLISTSYLLSHFGLSDFEGYINLPTDTLDDNSSTYLATSSSTYRFPVDSLSTVEFLTYPDASNRRSALLLSVYFSLTAPDGLPEYSIKNSLNYYPGTNFDFVISESPVLYSTDGVTYEANVSIDEVGEHTVYYKVGSDIILRGSSTVLITTGVIASDGLELLGSNIDIISNDNRTLRYSYFPGGESEIVYEYLTAEDGSTISPDSDTYEIYTNILKNSSYYNSMTHEALDVTVTVSEKNPDNPDFTYEVSCEGYVTLEGSVHFSYPFYYEEKPSVAGKEDMIVEGSQYNIILYVINPEDRNVSLSNLDTLYASRIIFSIESLTDEYDVLYSIDEGATWSDDIPSFSEVGEYKVYSIYKYYYDNEYYLNDEMNAVIVAIQNITITE